VDGDRIRFNYTFLNGNAVGWTGPCHNSITPSASPRSQR